MRGVFSLFPQAEYLGSEADSKPFRDVGVCADWNNAIDLSFP
jgi:hypothetical protein